VSRFLEQEEQSSPRRSRNKAAHPAFPLHAIEQNHGDQEGIWIRQSQQDRDSSRQRL